MGDDCIGPKPDLPLMHQTAAGPRRPISHTASSPRSWAPQFPGAWTRRPRFKDEGHLQRLLDEAQALVAKAMKSLDA